MVKQILFVAVLFFVFSCGTKNNRKVDQKQDSLSAHAIPCALVIKKDLGQVQERVYKGALPCADCPGIDYTLTLWNQEYSGDGVYDLVMDYIDRDSFKSSGVWGTFRGDADDINATVYLLNPDSTAYTQVNFLYKGDSLVMLGRNMKRINSGLNYTLHLVKNQ